MAIRAFGTAVAVGVVGVVAMIGAALRLYGGGRATMPSATGEKSVDMDPATALRDMAQALLVLGQNGEVTLDAGSNSAWLDTVPSWNSVSKRVTAEFEGHVVRVTSQSRRPASPDHGQNQANVDAVIAALERVRGRSHPTG